MRAGGGRSWWKVRVLTRACSIDDLIDESGDRRREELLDAQHPSPLDLAEQSERNDRLYRAIEAVVAKRGEEWIRDHLYRRFGLAGYEEHTLQQIGGLYGITREAVRQRERRVLRELREALQEELPKSGYG